MFEAIRERLTPRNIAIGTVGILVTAVIACGGTELIHHLNPTAAIHLGDIHINSSGILFDGCNGGLVQKTFGAQLTSFDWSNTLKGIQTFRTGCV